MVRPCSVLGGAADAHSRAGVAASWAYLFVVRGDAPLVISGRTISEREKLLGASGLSVAVIFFLTSVGSVLFSAVCVGLAGVAVHGALRVPDDLFLDDPNVRPWRCARLSSPDSPLRIPPSSPRLKSTPLG